MENSDYFCVKNDGIELLIVKSSKFNTPEHSHLSSYLIHWVAAGAFEVRRQSGWDLMARGDAFWIRPYEVHAIAAQTAYDLVTFVVPTGFLLENTLCDVLERTKRAAEHLRGFLPVMPGDILRILHMVVLAYHHSGGENIDNEAEPAVRNYIAHPEEKITLAELAKKAGFDRYYYLRLFKRNTGLTPHKFQLQNRIRKARRLLERNMTATEAALLTGFYDQSHFIRAFKKFVGISPTEYKKSLVTDVADLAKRRKEFGE